MLCAGVVAATTQKVDRPREPVVDECDGCEAIFEGMPETLSWSSRLAPVGEPGEAMRIDGEVRDKDGRPISNVIVYAYHTNAKGTYPPDNRFTGFARRHGKLRGWALTGKDGRYRFETIRPAGYPNSNLPAHVHMYVLEVGRCTYWIDDILFDDDPRLTESARGRMSPGRGGRGITKPVKDVKGTWLVTRDIVLGEEVPGYPERFEP